MGQSSYKDLIAWQKGRELVAAIYDAAEGFPSHEQFGLVSQLRRAAVSGRILRGLINSLNYASRLTQDSRLRTNL